MDSPQGLQIRQGTNRDFDKLWEWGDPQAVEQAIFMERMEAGLQELWVAQLDGRLVGELHVSWESPDKDEANGVNRAYLHTFRVHPAYRRRGIGTALIQQVLARIVDRGWDEVTIGADSRGAHLIGLYHRWGFTQRVKITTIDHHGFDQRGLPKQTAPYQLLVQRLTLAPK